MKILYFSSVAYNWMKQRPQFVAEKLSEKHEIEYLSLTPLGKKKEKDKPCSFVVKNLFVLPLALKSSVIRFFNKLYLNFRLDYKSYDLIVVTHPVQYSYIPKNAKFIYECMDLMEEFYIGKSKKTIALCEQKLIKKAKKIIVSSDALKTILLKKGAENDKVTTIKNAADKEWVYKNSKKLQLNHPNMVYVGTISDWFDIETIIRYCKSHPQKSVYIVGKSDVAFDNCPENLIFTGKVSHDMVRSYITSADIMLLPFKINHLVNCVDPVKMYEYLSFNKHIISTYWDELSQYKNNPLVHFYSDYEQFVRLAEIIPQTSDCISHEFITENCWDKRMEEYFKIIDGV